MIKHILFTLLLAAGCSTAFAQEKWDLERCIQHALSNNLQIKQQELTEQIAQNQILQSKAMMFPNLNADGSHAINFGRSVDPTTYQFVTERIQTSSYSLSSSVTLFNGLRQWNTIKQSKLELMASHYNTETTRNAVLLSITRAYLTILMGEETVRSIQEQANVSLSQLDQSQKLFNAGAIAEGGLWNIKSQLANDSLNLVVAQNNLDIAKLTLALMLQLDPATFQVAIPDLNSINVPQLDVQGAEGIYQYALGNQPQIKSADYSIQSAEKTLTIAKGFNYPTISLFGSLRSSYSSFEAPPFVIRDPYTKQLGDNFSQTVGIQLSIPIFNGLQTFTSVRNSKVRLLQAQVNGQQVKDQLKTDIYTAYSDAKAANQRFFASTKSVEAMQQTFTYAQSLFELGASNTLDYSTAKGNLAISQISLINAKYDYIFKVKVLDFYQGKPITLK